VRRGSIAYDAKPTAKRGRQHAIASPKGAATHTVVRVDGRLVLRRLRFACGCRHRRQML